LTSGSEPWETAMIALNNPGFEDVKRPLILALGCCALLGAWCWIEASILESRGSSYRSLVKQLEQMSVDSARVRSLRAQPRLATERERPNDELLAQIQQAMTVANIPASHWVGNDPTQPVRVSRSPYRRLAVRLMFEDLTLRQLVQFAYHLTQMDTALSIPRLRLSAPLGTQTDAWNVDLSLSYLIYSPFQSE